MNWPFPVKQKLQIGYFDHFGGSSVNKRTFRQQRKAQSNRGNEIGI